MRRNNPTQADEIHTGACRAEGLCWWKLREIMSDHFSFYSCPALSVSSQHLPSLSHCPVFQGLWESPKLTGRQWQPGSPEPEHRTCQRTQWDHSPRALAAGAQGMGTEAPHLPLNSSTGIREIPGTTLRWKHWNFPPIKCRESSHRTGESC